LTRVLQAGGLLGILVLVVLGSLAAYVAATWDRAYDAPLQEVRASTDPMVLARGEYLVYGPAHCVECHGPSFEALTQLGKGIKVPLSGGLRLPLGQLGVVYAPNLTPDPETGIGRYSDAHIARMMRWNVRPDGRASVDPMMGFSNMSDDDLVAIISYLRAQKPVKNAVPPNEWTLTGKVVRSLSRGFKPRTGINPSATAPAQAPTKERGEYLARYVANCVGCHTPRDQRTLVATGTEFSGGRRMGPWPMDGVDRTIWFMTPNLTPASGSALLKFPDRETFIARFQNGGRQHQGSSMPWEAFARMPSVDVAALYEFFRSLPATNGPTGEPTFVLVN
jgi:mono/diheme cytochrome c family protein